MDEEKLIELLQWKGLNLDTNKHVASKLLARYELFKKVIDLPGDIVECGVYRGATLFFWANMLEIFAPTTQRVVVGFDTFSGFHSKHKHQYDNQSSEKLQKLSGKFQSRSVSELNDVIDKLNLSHRIILVAGNASETIPKFLEERPGFRTALVNLDFDVYDPTIIALDNFYPRLVEGGIVASDQYGAHEWGESLAIDEFCSKNRIPLSTIAWASSPQAYFLKNSIH
ncbi:MAG: TylF/MycF/NovP-related O-methyltransferase [Agriterribacter sp.]